MDKIQAKSTLIYEKLEKQTWESFEAKKGDRKIFLIGAGKGIECFFQHYQYTLCVEGIIDNDIAKQGTPVSSYVFADITKLCHFPCVKSLEILKEYSNEDMILVISSLRYYVEIAVQLYEIGFENYFSLYFMRENEKSNKSNDDIDAFLEECCRFPIDPKKMIFYTMGGYSGHGKRIAELLLQKRNDLDIVWIIRRKELKVPKGIRVIRYDNRKKFIYEMETAGYWVFDDNITEFLKKREGQLYIQLKHWSSVTLKTFGKDLREFRQLNCQDIEDYICGYNGKIMDYVFIGSQFDEDSFRRAFAFEGEAIHVGSPRSDILFQEKRLKKKICDMYGIREEIHILLYAPTFRIEKTISGFQQNYKDTQLDLHKLHQHLEKRFGGTWVIFLRLHPNVAFRSKRIDTPPFVIDVSDYEDSQELVASSDVMITDYSSIMFEPAFVKKPVFLYAPDRHEYINQERQLLIDYDTLPFDIAETNDELCGRIDAFNQKEYAERLDHFFRKYGVHEDGRAGERAVAFILKLLEEHESCNR